MLPIASLYHLCSAKEVNVSSPAGNFPDTKAIPVDRKSRWPVTSQQPWQKENYRSATETIVVLSHTNTWKKKTILAKINKEYKGFVLQLLKESLCIYSATWWFSTCSLWAIEGLGDLQELAENQACLWKREHSRQRSLPPLWIFFSLQTESNVLTHNKITLQHIYKNDAQDMELVSTWWWVWYGCR